MDVKKIKSLKEAYPEEYKKKLETNQELMEIKLKELQKQNHQYKKQTHRFQDTLQDHQFVNQKLRHALEKAIAKNKALEAEKVAVQSDDVVADDRDGSGTGSAAPQLVRNDVAQKMFKEFDVPQNVAVEAKVDFVGGSEVQPEIEMVEDSKIDLEALGFGRQNTAQTNFKEDNGIKNEFGDVSSIIATPDAIDSLMNGMTVDQVSAIISRQVINSQKHVSNAKGSSKVPEKGGKKVTGKIGFANTGIDKI